MANVRRESLLGEEDMRKRSQLKRTVKMLRNLATDIRLGGLYGTVSQPHGWSSHANAVAPTDYGALPYIFGDHIIRPEDVLVDVGCGRGRVIRWWLHQGYTNKLIGVELDEKTASYARSKFRKWCNVEIIQGNIFDHMPPEATVFYCYNPFQRKWVERFRDRLVEVFATRKPVKLLYYNCRHVDVFHTDPRWSVQERDLHDIPNWLADFFHRLAIIELHP
jgi:SAM-dependent methyltransferase